MISKKGSLTVETALTLPIFMFLTIALISVIEMMSVYMNMEYALHETARETACSSYITGEISPGGLAATETLIRSVLVSNYGAQKLNNSLIKGKLLGIHLFRSEVPDDDGAIDLIVTYKVEPYLNLFDIGTMTFCNRARIHAWNGYGPQSYDISEEYVYITEHGKVYHTNPQCTYLHISIKTAGTEQLENIRNADGKKYTQCKLCFDKEKFDERGFVYITDRGEAYHTSLSCTGLKRSVYKIRLSEVGDRKLCTRCQNYKGGRKEENNDIDTDEDG